MLHPTPIGDNSHCRLDAIQILTPQTLPPVTIGDPVLLQLEARSQRGGQLCLEAAESQFVALNGLTESLSADGMLSGTPISAGYVVCGIAVTDAQGHLSSSLIAFYVVKDGQPSAAAHRGLGPISGTTSVGSLFSVRLTIAAGVQPYSVAVAPGSDLPPGLSLSTTFLSGFPTKAGSYAFANSRSTGILGATGALPGRTLLFHPCT